MIVTVLVDRREPPVVVTGADLLMFKYPCACIFPVATYVESPFPSEVTVTDPDGELTANVAE